MLTEQERVDILAWIREASGDDDKRLAHGHQGSLYLFEGDRGRLVIKVPKGRGVRLWLQRFMVRNEYQAYQQLAGVAGVPACLGLLEGRYLVLDYVDADSLETHKLVDSETFFARLREVIDRIHAAGVAHGDLRRRSNVLVAAGEVPIVIDFGTAVRSKPRSFWLRRRVFEIMCQDDRHSWVKLKYRRRRFAPPEERRLESPPIVKRIRKFVKRSRSLRSAWIDAPVESSDQKR